MTCEQQTRSMSSRRQNAMPWLVALLMSASLSTHAEMANSTKAEAVSVANTRGVAYMHQQQPEKAAHAFEQATLADRNAVTPLVNEGIAYLYSRQLSNADEILTRATKVDPHSVRAWYSLGVVAFTLGDEVSSLDAFERSAALDPTDPDTHYFLGTILSKDKRFEEAIQQFTLAIDANPLHASAEFGLAQALQRSGKTEDARKHQKRFQEISDKKIGTLISANYGEQGRYVTVEDVYNRPPAAAPMIPVHFAPLQRVSSTRAVDATMVGGGVCVLDLMGDGSRDLVTTEPSTGIQAFRITNTTTLEPIDLIATGLTMKGDGVACAVGDFDNDRLPDLAIALTDRVVLFHNLGHGRFADVTEKLGITARNKPKGLTFVDYDHDGDLDLFVTGMATTGAANILWRNNGNDTFTEWTGPTGLTGSGPTTEAVLSDLNNDRAVDLVVGQTSGSPLIYENQREGAFEQRPLYPETTLPASRGIAVADFNKDNTMDIALTHREAPGVSLWFNDGTARFSRVSLPLDGVTGGWGITPLDFDNDGWIDLAALVNTQQGMALRVFRNLGAGGFQDVTETLGLRGLNLNAARSVTALDVNEDGAADLVIGRVGAPPLLLLNVGGGKNHSLRIDLTGLADNKSGLGTKLEVFSDSSHQKFEITGASGYMGQGSTEVLAGLGSSTSADVVRLLWPTGVPQDEIEVSASKPLALTELDRRGSSCPVLFAWDGARYTFVSDVIGAGVVGHWISPTSRNQPDPDEWTKINGALLQPHNGNLSVRFGEPMEETNYVDQLRLIAVDHPRGTEVFPDEKFLNDPPFASGKPMLASASAHLPAAAWDDRGKDAIGTLSRIDHRYLQDFNTLSYAGFANEHTLTLDLGAWTPANPLRLFLHGYVEYFSASSLYAAWQAGIQPHSPSVEAQMPDGSWRLIVKDMGFPAGLPRTVVADLSGKMPSDARRIRIRTNLQIYWDQILVDNAPQSDSSIRLHELPLDSAHLEFRGYPRQIEGATPGDLTYDYQEISQTGPFLWHSGSYTHYGDVTPLLMKRDNHFVIFGTGEDIDAEFSESALPKLSPGWARDYFFYADGFVKDMDFHEALPFTVSELPFSGMSQYPYTTQEHFPEDPDSLAYQLDWNDRVESGARTQRYVFEYKWNPSRPIDPGR